MLHLGFTAAILTFLAAVALHEARAAIVLVMVFLALLGDLRRLASSLWGFPSLDPFHLVGPALVGFLLVGVVMGRRLSVDTGLSKLIVALIAVMVIQIFNPLQGGVVVGVMGALFYLVPLLWFWLGKAYGSGPFLESIAFRVVLPVAVLAAFLGMYQVFFGFLPFEEKWIQRVGYSALWVGETIRPFSFFTSAAEYASFLGLAMSYIWSAWLQRRSWTMILFPFLALALFLESGRGAIVSLCVSLAVLWALQGRVRLWAPRLLVALLFAALGLYQVLTQVQSVAWQGPTESLVSHQVEGLLNPMDEEHSTLPIHLAMVQDGFRKGFETPLGHGLGFTTLAAAKWGQAGVNTEIDVSNMFVSLGVVGGFLYLAVMIGVYVKAIRLWARTRSFPALLALATLGFIPGTWLIGGEYSVTALTWFFIGALDRACVEYQVAEAYGEAPYAAGAAVREA